MSSRAIIGGLLMVALLSGESVASRSKTKGPVAVAGRAVISAPEVPLLPTSDECGSRLPAQITVDQGHPWRPPFGLDRVGAMPVVHVKLVTNESPRAQYFLHVHQDGSETKESLQWSSNPAQYPLPNTIERSAVFANVRLTSVPTEISLHVRCNGYDAEIARKEVKWPELEWAVEARSDHSINPIDWGTVFTPRDWLLLAGAQTAAINVAVLARDRDFPQARLKANFIGARSVAVDLPIKRGQRQTRALEIPVSTQPRSTLRVSLVDGDRELWTKEIQTTYVEKPLERPSFGAVETKLRYDAPILAFDPRTGQRIASTSYDRAWDVRRNDVVVFLPNGSRFVFWRGASYVPFWAARNNTGILYQWAENCSSELLTTHPDGTKDCPEALFDTELRYSRVRIVESSASRVHVRWDYQLTDVRYEVWGGSAAEDYYFYPDGFGTRVVTVPAPSGMKYQLSEFIIITPQAAYPFEVLPRRLIVAIDLDGGTEAIDFPFDPARPSKIVKARATPMVYRVFSDKESQTSAIYFHPDGADAVPAAYPPFYDRGEIATPAYWGNHWPLTRGKWTVWTINDQVGESLGHNSIAEFTPRADPKTGRWSDSFEVTPFASDSAQMPNVRGQVCDVNLSRFAWLIAHTDLTDERLREWGKSFRMPPALEVSGAQLDLPSYSAERRALRLVAESNAISVRLKPSQYTVNPVFEIDRAPKKLMRVLLDGQEMPTEAYAWDGDTLWIRARIDSPGATIRLLFE